MQHRIYQTKVKDLDDSDRRLFDAWAGTQQSLIDDVINYSGVNTGGLANFTPLILRFNSVCAPETCQ